MLLLTASRGQQGLLRSCRTSPLQAIGVSARFRCHFLPHEESQDPVAEVTEVAFYRESDRQISSCGMSQQKLLHLK